MLANVIIVVLGSDIALPAAHITAASNAPQYGLTVAPPALQWPGGEGMSIRQDLSSPGYYASSTNLAMGANVKDTFDQWGLDGKTGSGTQVTLTAISKTTDGDFPAQTIQMYELELNGTIIANSLVLDCWTRVLNDGKPGQYRSHLIYNEGDCKAITCLNSDCSAGAPHATPTTNWTVCYTGPALSGVKADKSWKRSPLNPAIMLRNAH